MRYGYICWPEGEPGRATYAGTRCGMWWRMYGPPAFGASIRGKRMTSYWPALAAEDHARTAANMERVMDLHRQHFGGDAQPLYPNTDGSPEAGNG